MHNQHQRSLSSADQHLILNWQPQSIWGRWSCRIGDWRGYVSHSILPAGWRAALVSPTEALYAEQFFQYQSAAEAWVEQQLHRLVLQAQSNSTDS